MKNTNLHIAVVGMGLIGGSIYKAATQAGYSVRGIDRDDKIILDDTDLLVLALPQEAITPWMKNYAQLLKAGTIIVDTCGVKSSICGEMAQLVPASCTFIGGHPMAGKELSGFAYADACLFKGKSMILTPFPNTPPEILEQVSSFFENLGFSKIITTTPEKHDQMIAYTSQLCHVIAASYIQNPLSQEASGYAAGSYGNMTRIASMNPEVWANLFVTNRDNLLPILDDFITRCRKVRDLLATENIGELRNFIQQSASNKTTDGIERHIAPTIHNKNCHTIGHHLKLQISGASHAPGLRMQMDNFPGDEIIDLTELQNFMNRRAPGLDKLSTSRKENDIPEFISGLSNGRTTGEKIEAIIANSNIRPQDYSDSANIPRPGHADYPQWVQTGRIPSGGGENSGRMTAPMCIAGGLCLQWLRRRNISVSSRLISVGNETLNFADAIQRVQAQGDSIGAVIEIIANGMPAGIGGAMFGGLESDLSAALLAIPGVKGIEFGAGFAAAKMQGTQNNDEFICQNQEIRTATNNHGGILGGMTTAMPIVIRLAMKPTPSIFLEQNSVNLQTKLPEKLTIHGRHDPCIARRAMPVAEALTAYVLADAILTKEAQTPRICLTLSEDTIDADLTVLKNHQPFVDLVELRIDHLKSSEIAMSHKFTDLSKIPTILTIRRKTDGGQWQEPEDKRIQLFKELLTNANPPFAYVDFEDDFRLSDLEDLAHRKGTKIIRSHHDFSGPIKNIIAKCQSIKGSSNDIPKIAFMANCCSDLTDLLRETADFTGFEHIICAMGEFGMLSRILAGRTHSMLTYTSPENSRLSALGHLSPNKLIRTYNFRKLTANTRLYGVTGWPLSHTKSPELNNDAFFAAAKDAIMVPIPAQTAAEAIDCAEALGIKGMAVTIPHKEAIIPFLSYIEPEAFAIGAVNTLVKTPAGWKGYNTDIGGFQTALLEFLQTDTIAGRKVAIIGAGGAAKAICQAIDQLGGVACIFNKTYEKAASLAQLHGFKAAPLTLESKSMLKEYSDIIIQCTSVGLKATSAEENPIPFYDFDGTENLYDLVYEPGITPIMAKAMAAGCKTSNGLSMLVAQAELQRKLYEIHSK